MRWELVEVVHIRLAMAEPLAAAHGTTSHRESVLVRVVGPDGEGWGECVALSDPGYHPETVAVAREVLADRMAPALLAAGEVAAAEVAANVGTSRAPMATAAVELAVLDAELRAAGRSLAEHLGVDRTTVPAGAVAGITADTGTLLETVGGLADAGYRRVKCKIRPGWDVAPLSALRGEHPDLALAADANGSYRLADPDHRRSLGDLDRLGLEMIEQPLAPDDLAGHARLAAGLTTPVCLDESVSSLPRLEEVLAAGAADVVSLKWGRLGGVAAARRAHDICVAAGVALTCGGMIETGVGRPVTVTVAGLPGCTVTGDVSASDRWFPTDVAPPVTLRPDGTVAVPREPGACRWPDPDLLGAATVTRTTVRR